MSAQHGTISIHFVQQALASVSQTGLAVGPLLDKAGIPQSFLEEPLARVSPQQFGALWREIASHLDDEFFALDRHPARQGTYLSLCQALIGCATLGQALRHMCRFARVVLDDMRAELLVQDGVASLVLHDDRQRESAFAHATFFMVAYGLACWLVARRIPLSHCQLAGAAQGHEAEYRLMFAEHLAFGAHTGRLDFSAMYLARPVVQTAQSLRGFLRQVPDVFLVKYRNANGLAARVRRRLRSSHPDNWPNLAGLASDFGLTQATLRRRLQQEGVGLQTIKDALRRDMAIERLRMGHLSMERIAADLGFAEAAAFHRAFKKWTGMRPSDYRLNPRDSA